jgi:predicted MFS family arabinose efflux permease
MSDQENKSWRWSARLALMVAHCAGMVDLVALPVWVGTLITRYGLDPQRAGGLATLFLLGAVGSSLFWAPRFDRLRPRKVAAYGFGIAALAFLGIACVSGFIAMAALHAVAGAAAGSGLSVTHGTIGGGPRPHRMFAMAGLALGVFAIAFLGLAPGLIAAAGGATLFYVFAAVMLTAAVVCALAFPGAVSEANKGIARGNRLSSTVWFAALGISCMGLVQAMMFSFLERIGADRGFPAAAVTGVLVALGVVNLFPAPLAALLEHKWRARTVVLAGPVVQTALALTIAHSSSFAPYACAAAVFAAVMIFTHTFAFGLIAQLDPGGRALTATPAMLMVGAAIGPLLGGTVVKAAGYGMLGGVAVFIACVAVYCFGQAGRTRSPVFP